MIDGSLRSNETSNSDELPIAIEEFTLKSALAEAPNQELTWDLLTKVPNPNSIKEIEAITKSEIKSKILKTLRNPHINVIEKKNVEHQRSFSSHSAVDPLYESKTGTVIKGKSHAAKALGHYNGFVSTIGSIDKHVRNTRDLSEEEKNVLDKCKSFFKAQTNAYVYVLKNLDDNKKSELIQNSGVQRDIALYGKQNKKAEIFTLDDLKFYELSPEELQQVQSFLPASPVKMPFSEKTTPDALTPNKKRSLRELEKAEAAVNPRRDLTKSARRRLNCSPLASPIKSSDPIGESSPALVTQFNQLSVDQDVPENVASSSESTTTATLTRRKKLF